MKTIELTQGKFAIVDDEDYEYLSQFKWFAVNYRGRYYAGRKNKSVILMHRDILKPEPRQVIDHIDHNGLNNQRGNIRACTRSQNAMNTVVFGKSKYKGVWFSTDNRNAEKTRTRIRASIRVDGKLINLGTFQSEELAAMAYDDAAKKHFGEFANINFKPVTTN